MDPADRGGRFWPSAGAPGSALPVPRLQRAHGRRSVPPRTAARPAAATRCTPRRSSPLRDREPASLTTLTRSEQADLLLGAAVMSRHASRAAENPDATIARAGHTGVAW